MARPLILDVRPEGRLARRLFSTAYMSDSKWRKFMTAVEEAMPNIAEMTVKFVDVDKTHRMRFPPSLLCPRAYMDTIEFGPVSLRSIEWMEIAADLEPVLAPLGFFPIEVSRDRTRVLGYR